MSLERNPMLPKGFYWIDLLGDDKAAGFERWRSANASSVKVRDTVDQRDSTQHRTWIKWEVTAPVLWLAPSVYGYPNRATASTTIDDAGGAEKVKDPLDQIGEKVNLETIASGAKTVGFWALVALVVVKVLKR